MDFKPKFNKMRYILVSIILLFFFSSFGQNLPHHMTEEEKGQMKSYLQNISSKGYTTPPQGNLRAPGEWEEIDYLTITWESYEKILSQVVKYAQKEATVIIHCSDSNTVKTELNNYGVTPTNVMYIEAPSNSVWIRDYGAQTVYKNGVDSLMLVDWIYNRPRPDDDAIPGHTASALNLPLYQTTQSPYKLITPGGNFMTDGFGTAFSSNLILDDNPNLSESKIDSIMYKFMGIDTFIHMTNLPYDIIHHIDMHMKLLDEETLLVGEYPQGVADGPQIEANLQYVLNNFQSKFNTPFDVVRIPMPPSPGGYYPDNGGYYRTYTNSVFINNSLLVPTYYKEYDTTALRILRENLPGYNVTGINSSDIISASGAIHCITNSIGSDNPLLISHQPYDDTVTLQGNYDVDATIRHRSGISSATLYYTADTSSGYQSVSMSSTASNQWEAHIPQQNNSTEIFYYISATSNSGKTMTRPMPAPKGYWSFIADPATGIIEKTSKHSEMADVFPNPASAITAIPVISSRPEKVRIYMLNTMGQQVKMIFEGQTQAGKNHYFIDASKFSAGTYLIRMESATNAQTQKLIIRE